MATSQKSRAFAIPPLSPRLSGKLPALISGGWRGKEPAEARPHRASRRPWRVPAPFRKELGTSPLHLDPSRRPPSFCLRYQGQGVLFDPRAGQRWRPEGPLNPRWILEGAGRTATATSCSKGQRSRAGDGGSRPLVLCPLHPTQGHCLAQGAAGPPRTNSWLCLSSPELIESSGTSQEWPSLPSSALLSCPVFIFSPLLLLFLLLSLPSRRIITVFCA